MKLWLDDRRPPPDASWTWVRTAHGALTLLKRGGVEQLDLDHDLGHCIDCCGCKGYGSRCGCLCHMTGYSVVLAMVEFQLWPKEKPRVHSQNPVGRDNMRATIDRYWDDRDTCIVEPAKYSCYEPLLCQCEPPLTDAIPPYICPACGDVGLDMRGRGFNPDQMITCYIWGNDPHASYTCLR